jgi:hypothetical protein
MPPKRKASPADKNPAPEKKAAQDGDVIVNDPTAATFDGKPAEGWAEHRHPRHRQVSDVRCEHGENPDFCVPCLTKKEDDVRKKLAVAKRRTRSAWTSTHMCDGCHRTNRSGIRYICTECLDMDFCQNCVDADVHIEHALIRLKYEHQHIGNRRYASYGGGWGGLQ